MNQSLLSELNTGIVILDTALRVKFINASALTILDTTEKMSVGQKIDQLFYEDPESFEDVSAEISSTITEIASTVEPDVEDSDLDGLIQEIMKTVDKKAAEIEKELSVKEKPAKKSKSKK